MQIYKAPKILMFHLKRFKASNKMFKQKLETLVDFPLSGLDLSEFIINSNIPEAYSHEDQTNNGENKERNKYFCINKIKKWSTIFMPLVTTLED